MRQLKIQKSITNRSSEALDKYLVEIGRAPLISIDEEIELAQKIKKGGREGERAKDKLVTANLRFVVSVAKQYQHQGLTLTDLIDEGNIGLIKAAQKFDETRGFKFISYAVWWIRQSILQAIAEQSRIVRLPLNQVGSLSKINHEINKFEQLNQRHPSVSELSEKTNMTTVCSTLWQVATTAAQTATLTMSQWLRNSTLCLTKCLRRERLPLSVSASESVALKKDSRRLATNWDSHVSAFARFARRASLNFAIAVTQRYL